MGVRVSSPSRPTPGSIRSPRSRRSRVPAFSLTLRSPRRNVAESASTNDRSTLIRRRAAIALCSAGALLSSLPPTAKAQWVGTAYSVGILGQTTRYAPIVDDLRSRLDEIGRSAGFTVKFEERWADDHWEDLPKLAAELVALRVDLMVANGDTPTVAAAVAATRRIPIVFLWASDPVGQGFVQSLSRPGGNVTGLSILGPEIEVKRLELLKLAAPKIARVAVLTNRAASDLHAPLTLLQSASHSLGVQLSVFDVRAPPDLAKVLDQVARAEVDGIVVQDDYMLNLLVPQVADFALKRRLPVAAEALSNGVLVAYRFDWDEQFLRAAKLIGKILSGANPGDLPVEQPTKFELVVDLRTARQLGLVVPSSVLMRADKIIQ